MTADFSYFDVMLGLGPCLYRIIISWLFQYSFFVGILNFELMKFETIQERYFGRIFYFELKIVIFDRLTSTWWIIALLTFPGLPIALWHFGAQWR